MEDPEAVVSPGKAVSKLHSQSPPWLIVLARLSRCGPLPGGVGFDINCGVRLLRTNLTEADVAPVKETLAQAMFDHIPVGVGSRGVIPMTAAELDQALEMGMDWSLQKGTRPRCLGGAVPGPSTDADRAAPPPRRSVGYAWPEDKEHCEEYGRMLQADARKVSDRAKKRGLPQVRRCVSGRWTASSVLLRRPRRRRRRRCLPARHAGRRQSLRRGASRRRDLRPAGGQQDGH